MTYWAETAPSLSTRSSGGGGALLLSLSLSLLLTAALFPLSLPYSYLMMDLFRRGELGLLGGGEGLRDDVGVSGISWSANRLSEDVYPASGLALAAAYHDIKTRLASLERENSSIKRKLKHYEVKVKETEKLKINTFYLWFVLLFIYLAIFRGNSSFLEISNVLLSNT